MRAVDTRQPSIGSHLRTPRFGVRSDPVHASVSELREPSASALSRQASDLPLHQGKRRSRARFVRRQRECRPRALGGGRIRSEWVAGFRRNQWPDCAGISGRIGSDYAVFYMKQVESAPVNEFSHMSDGELKAFHWEGIDYRYAARRDINGA